MHFGADRIVRTPITFKDIQKTEYKDRFSKEDWQCIRQFMATGSRGHKIKCNCRANLTRLAHSFSHRSGQGPMTDDMARGQDMEQLAVFLFALLSGWSFDDIMKPGIIRHLYLLWLAATPDLLYQTHAILEMKNTRREFPALVGEYIIKCRKGCGGRFLGSTPPGMNLTYRMNPNHSSHTQVIIQLVTSGRSESHFVIFSSQDSVPYSRNRQSGAWAAWSESLPLAAHMWTQVITLQEAIPIFKRDILPKLMSFYYTRMAVPSLRPGVSNFVPTDDQLASPSFVPLEPSRMVPTAAESRYIESVANLVRTPQTPASRSQAISRNSAVLAGVEELPVGVNSNEEDLEWDEVIDKMYKLGYESGDSSECESESEEESSECESDESEKDSSGSVHASTSKSCVELSSGNEMIEDDRNLAIALAKSLNNAAASQEETEGAPDMEVDQNETYEERVARTEKQARELAAKMRREKEELRSRNFSVPTTVNTNPQNPGYTKNIGRTRSTRSQAANQVNVPSPSSTGLSQPTRNVAISRSSRGTVPASSILKQKPITNYFTIGRGSTAPSTGNVETQKPSSTAKGKNKPQRRTQTKPTPLQPKPAPKTQIKPKARPLIIIDDESSDDNKNQPEEGNDRARNPSRRKDESMEADSNISSETHDQQQSKQLDYVEAITRQVENQLRVSQTPLHPSAITTRKSMPPVAYERGSSQANKEDPMAESVTEEVRSRTVLVEQRRSIHTTFEQQKLEAEKREELKKIQPNIQNYSCVAPPSPTGAATSPDPAVVSCVSTAAQSLTSCSIVEEMQNLQIVGGESTPATTSEVTNMDANLETVTTPTPTALSRLRGIWNRCEKALEEKRERKKVKKAKNLQRAREYELEIKAKHKASPDQEEDELSSSIELEQQKQQQQIDKAARKKRLERNRSLWLHNDMEDWNWESTDDVQPRLAASSGYRASRATNLFGAVMGFSPFAAATSFTSASVPSQHNEPSVTTTSESANLVEIRQVTRVPDAPQRERTHF